MNYIDLILLFIIFLSVVHGIRKGFIEMLMELMIWLGSFLTAIFLSKYITMALTAAFDASDLWVRPITFVILLIGSSWFISSICDRILRTIEEPLLESFTNKLLGVIPGLFSGFIYAGLISFFLNAYPVGKLSTDADNSTLAQLFTNRPVWLGENVIDAFRDLGMKLGSGVTLHPEGAQTINLPFKTSSAKVRNDLELQMLELLNTERSKKGLVELVFDEELAVVARKHSEDMFERGYFSHYTPEAKNPFDRIRENGLKFRIAGENLALAQNLELAHQGLMESPTHKANILHKSFRRAGIGILDGGVHGIIVTQNFRN